MKTKIFIIKHFILAIFLGIPSLYFYASIIPAAALLVCIELVQADCWGEVAKIEKLVDRIVWWFEKRDTQRDLIADAIGLAVAAFVFYTALA